MVRPGLQRTGRLVLSDQIATLPVVLLPDLVGTEDLQDHPAGVPVVVRRGVQSLDHREDLVVEAEVHREDQAGAVVPLGN